MTITTDRERQRVNHLVLGRPRPKTARSRKTRKRVSEVVLAPGVEEGVLLRERWSHKQGTPETHEHADQARSRPGSLARLFTTGAIDKDQLAAADEIAAAFAAVTSVVAVRTASLEARIDGGAHGRAETEALGRVYAEFAYTWWRAAVGGCGEALLDIIVHDIGLTIVAKRHGISMPRARRMLTDGLDLWWVGRAHSRRAARAAL